MQKAVLEPPAYKNRYIILCIVLAGVFMGVLDANVVNVALPTITTYFHVDMAQSQWVVTSYLVANTGLLLIFGRLSDHTGKVRLFFAGIALFTLSSLACGLSSGIDHLIFFRVVQGIGASVVFSINTAILVTSFPRNERGKALGFIGTIVAIGSIAGPILGGFLVDSLGWQYVFFINVPVGIVLLATAAKYLKIEETRVKELNMDWVGAAALVISVVTLMLLLSNLSQGLDITIQTSLLALIFLGSLAGFISTELNHRNPIIDLRVFGVKKFSYANLSLMINFTAFSMFIITMPFFLELVWGYSPSQVGQTLLMVPLIMGVVAPVSGWLYDKLQSTYHSSFGMAVTAVALFSMSYATRQSSPVLLLACLGLFGLGTSLFTSPNNTEVMSALPPQKSSTSSSVLATVRNFGNAVGVSFANILLYMQLDGSVITARPAVLSQSISTVLLIGGVLCLAGVLTSLMVRWSKDRAAGT